MTAITQSLVSLDQAKNHKAFLNIVSRKTRSIDDANMYQAAVAMIAAYNRTQLPVSNLGTFEKIMMFRNNKGAYVITFPIDNFLWTKRSAEKTMQLTKKIPAKAKKELWISGHYSDLAVQKLKELGWVIYDQAFSKLGTGNPY